MATSDADKTDEPADKPYPTEPALDALDVSELACRMRLDGVEESYRAARLALEDLDRASGSIAVAGFPKLVFYYGSEYEKLLTAHGLFFFEPRIGSWYWANTQTPLGELCDRFPAYAAYFLDRSRRQLEIYRRDKELSEQAGLSGADFLAKQIDALEQAIAAVEDRQLRDQQLPR